MKKYLVLLFTTLITQLTLADSNLQLVSKISADTKFTQAVETAIRKTFASPSAVKLKFRGLSAHATGPSTFQATYTYLINASGTAMGQCTYSMKGSVLADQSLSFRGIAHEDCGE